MQPFRFYLITDTHYFAPSLGCRGPAYEEFMQGEQKCFAETKAINEASLAWLGEAKDADTVLIAGDLSFNGEKQSHLEFIELLKKLKEAGKRVCVITAGHDFNEHPFCFDENGRGEPEGTKREELFDLYYEFGFSDAIAVDRDSLSYVAQLSDGLRLLALNNDGDENRRWVFTEKQTAWIKDQTKKAREEGQTMIAMTHYPLLAACPVWPLIGNCMNPDHENVTTMLADEGVHLCFTGHMHNQSVKCKVTEQGNKFWDVCTGSLIGDPSCMRLVTVESPEKAKIETIPTPPFDWDMEGLTNEEYFKRQFNMMINNYLDFAENNPTRLLGKLGVKNPAPVLVKIVGVFGKRINRATVGSVCKKFRVKCDDSIKARPLRDLMLDIVRNIFVGNAPYVEGTPEYDAVMGIIGKLSFVTKIVKKKKGLDIPYLVKYSIGHYGVDENNTEIGLV